jgi:hypothetical protein
MPAQELQFDTPSTESHGPVEFFSDLLKDDPGKERGPLLSVKNIIDLQRYESLALELPTNEDEIRALMGNYNDEPGLSVADFSRVFSIVREHARLWTSLRDGIASLLVRLESFAGDVEVANLTCETLIKNIKAARADFSGLPDTYAELLVHEHLPGTGYLASVSSASTQVVDGEGLVPLIEELCTDIEAYALVLDAISVGLDEFCSSLVKKMWGETSTLILALQTSRLGTRAADHENAVQQLKAAQAQLVEQYRTTQAQWGEFGKLVSDPSQSANVGCSVTDGNNYYRGLLAACVENAAKLQAEEDKLFAQAMPDCRPARELEERLRKLKSMGVVFLEAQAALRNLRIIWGGLESRVQASSKEITAIEDDYSLLCVAQKMRWIAQPWTDVRQKVAQLRSRVKAAQANQG